MFKRASLIAMLLLIAGVQTVNAAEQTQPLTFAAALKLALAGNPSYLAAATDIDAAAARVKVARGPRLPSATVSEALAFADPVATLQTPLGALPFAPNATNVPLATIAYTLYDGGVTAERVARADAELVAAHAAQREAATNTLARVAAAYYDLAGAFGGVDVAQRGVNVAGDHVRLVQQRLNQGMAARADLLEVQTELAQARVRAIDAQNAVDRASNDLDAGIGVPLDKRYRPSEPLAGTIALPPLAGSISVAFAERGELAAAQEAVIAARAAVAAERAAGRPKIGIGMSEGNTQPAIEPGFHSQFAVALSAVWTVFDNGVTAANVAVADAGVRRAEFALAQMRTSVELDVRQSFADAEAAQQRVAAALALVAAADENQRLADIRYRGGVGTVLELRDAETQATSAGQRAAAAEADAQRSIAALHFASGLSTE